MGRISTKAAVLICIGCLFFACLVLYVDDDATFRYTEDLNEINRVFDSEKETGINSSNLMKQEYADKRFKYRIDHMKEICKSDEDQGLWSYKDSLKYSEEWVRNDNFVVVPNRSFLVCVLPKCGSSSWHWLARDMRDPLSAGHTFGWQDRQKNTEISQELDPAVGARLMGDKNAFIAIAVRHPFAKMISGWNDKLASDMTYASFLLEAYPHMQKFASSKDGKHLLAFEDLAEYIATYGDDIKNLDYHFMPMQNLCRPCLYPYNHVVKLESLAFDQQWIKKKLNVTDMPWQQKGSAYFTEDQRNPTDIIRAYFKHVKKSTILKLMELYYYDFILFGYTFDVDTLTAGGFV